MPTVLTRLLTASLPFAIIAVAGTCLTGVPSAQAAARVAALQPGMGGGGGGGMFGGMFGGGGGSEMPVTTAELDRMKVVLKLTPEQSEALKLLHEGMNAALQPKMDEMRKATEEARDAFRETRDFTVWEGLREKGQALQTARRDAETAFLNDAKSLLTEDQAALWPKLERERRRDRGMRQGFVSGERADVIRIVNNLKLPEEVQAKVTPVLDSYEVELDTALTRRTELTEKLMNQMGGQGFRGMMDAANNPEMQKAIEEGREAAVRVREVNRRFARQVMGELPEEFAGKFDAEFKRESFPQIYRQQQWSTRVLAAVDQMELETSAKQAIDAIRDKYTRESAALNAKQEEATEKNEAEFSIDRMMRMQFETEDMQKLRTQRRELEDKTVESIRAILTPEQAAKLPERRAGGGGDGAQPGEGRRRGGEGGGDGNDRPRRRPGQGGGNGGGEGGRNGGN